MAKTQEQELSELQLQAARDAVEKARIEKELAANQLELQRAQLEALKRENKDARAKEEATGNIRKHAAVRMKQTKEETARKQAICNHRMGGKNLDGLYNGGDVFTTYQVEYNNFGLAQCRCIRCDKIVKPGEKDFDEIFRLPRKGLEAPKPVQFRFARG
jgi:hypothetical protein